MNGMKWNAPAFILGVLMVGLPQTVLADLVLDDEPATGEAAVSAKTAAKVEDREATRKIVKKTQAIETTQEIVSDPVVSQAAEPVAGDSDYAARSELLRRKRMREEMKNEDLLQQRLEELRLRDEEKRTQKVLKSTGLDEETAEAEKKKESEAKAKAAAAAVTTAPVLEEELVVAPVTEAPAAPPASYQMNPAPVTGVATHDQIIVNQSSTAPASQSATSAALAPAPSAAVESAGVSATSSDSVGIKDEEKTRISIQPRFGLLSIQSNQYDMNAKFAAGIGLGFEATDQIAVEIGYTYAETGIQSPYAVYTGMNPEVLTYKQNIFDVGMKLYFTESSSRVRPYVGAGAGYALGYLNYSDAYRTYYTANNSDYEMKSFLGILSAGLDFKVSSKISVGAGYKYLNVLSSSQSSSIDNRAFYPYGYSGYGTNYDPVKTTAGNSLRDSNMHLIQLGASFSF